MSDIVFRMKVETKVLRDSPSMAWRGHISADLMEEAATTIATLRKALEDYMFAEEIDDPAERQGELLAARQHAANVLAALQGNSTEKEKTNG